MNDIDYYKTTKTPYPAQEDFTTYNVNDIVNCEAVHKNISKEELEAAGFKPVTRREGKRIQKDDYIVINCFDEEAYKEQLDAYAKESGQKDAEFRHDLAVDNNIDPNSHLAAAIYSQAYDKGHSYGHYQIQSDYEDICNFLEKVEEAKKKDLE